MLLRLAALLALTATAMAATTEWREESALAGVTYDGRADADGVSAVAGWRLDGGVYVSDEHFTLNFVSAKGRTGVMLSTFVSRAEDGVATFTAGKAMSVPVIDNFAYTDINCAEVGSEWNPEQTKFIVGIVPKTAASNGAGQVGSLIAAAKVDVTAGTITPVDPKGIYCIQEEGH